ncbi:MAG: M48 family metallopeptidase [Syntrophobacter sp.]
MMNVMEGDFFDGVRPVRVPAKMEFIGIKAILTVDSVSERYATPDLRVSPRTGSTKRFITFPDSGQFACADHPYLDFLPQESESEGPVAWLENHWFVSLASVAVVFCSLILGYLFGLPKAADLIAARIPMEVEQALGRQTVSVFDKNGLFKPTDLHPEIRKTIKSNFDKLCGDLPLKKYYQLEFRSGSVGPNAFALPGGIIVITDDMVKLTGNPDEIVAALAHEIGHVELRHTMRSVLQNSIVAALAATVTSDAASLSVAVAGLPVMLARTKYSREFESEADDYSFRMLKGKGYSPEAFATLMEKLSKKEVDYKKGAFNYISSHPVTAERVQRARDAAAR